MKVLTAAQMREVDRRTIQMGIPAAALMENAGTRVTEFLDEKFSPLGEHRVFVFCGKGNNGGDGMVVARQLFTRYHPKSLDVVLVGSADQLKGEAAENYRLLVGRWLPGAQRRTQGSRTRDHRCRRAAGHGRARACHRGGSRGDSADQHRFSRRQNRGGGHSFRTGQRYGKSARRIRASGLHGYFHGSESRPDVAAELRARGRAACYVPSAAHPTCTKATTASFFHWSSPRSSTVCSNRGRAQRTRAVLGMCWFWLALAEKRGRRPWLEWRHCALALAW